MNERKAIRGVPLMFAASACFALMSAFVKALGPTFPFVEVMLFRATLALPVLAVLSRRRRLGFRPRQRALLLLRGVLGLAAMLCYFYALQRGVLAEITVIGRLQPALVAIFAPLLIREQVPATTVAVLAASLCGVVLVVKPAGLSIDLASLAALVAALLSALAHLAVRRLNASNDPLVIVIGFTLVIAVGSLALSVPVFVVPTPLQLLLLCGVALSATAAQLAMTTAYDRDRASVIAAASYLQVVFAGALGYLVWRELPDTLSLIGASLIICGGVFHALRRRALEKAR